MYLSINSPPPCVFPLNLLLASKGVASSIVHITGTSLCCVMPADLFLASFFFFLKGRLEPTILYTGQRETGNTGKAGEGLFSSSNLTDAVTTGSDRHTPSHSGHTLSYHTVWYSAVQCSGQEVVEKR